MRALIVTVLVIVLGFAQQPAPAWAQASTGCQLAPARELIQLDRGDIGRVTAEPPLANRLRDRARLDAEIVGVMQPLDQFVVVGGPVCRDGYRWWRVEFGEITGWTADGSGREIWIEPVPSDEVSTPAPTTTPAPPATPVVCRNAPTNYLAVGRAVWVVEDDIPNILYDRPSLEAEQLRVIPPDTQMTITGGPQCGDNLRWWYVEYGSYAGWTPDGQGRDRYLRRR